MQQCGERELPAGHRPRRLLEAEGDLIVVVMSVEGGGIEAPLARPILAETHRSECRRQVDSGEAREVDMLGLREHGQDGDEGEGVCRHS